MTTHIQQNELFTTGTRTRLPRPARVALIAGVLWAGVLLVLAQPLLIATGLWLLGMALVLVGYALLVHRHFEMAVWDTAIFGQGLGLLGMALLFGASLLS